jgi:hypothetical protein
MRCRIAISVTKDRRNQSVEAHLQELAVLQRFSAEDGVAIVVHFQGEEDARQGERHQAHGLSVEPLLHEPGVEFLGELGGRDKAALIEGAAALLFPISGGEQRVLSASLPAVASSQPSPEVSTSATC